MADGFAPPALRDRLAPPLQADGAELRFAHLPGDARKLDIEGAESKKIGPGFARGEGGGKGAVEIARPRDCPYRVVPSGLMQGSPAFVAQARTAAGPLPLAEAGAALHASRRTPRMSCNGEATKIDE
jgi:hypothetical protein